LAPLKENPDMVLATAAHSDEQIQKALTVQCG
jgi:hypothetical protein